MWVTFGTRDDGIRDQRGPNRRFLDRTTSKSVAILNIGPRDLRDPQMVAVPRHELSPG